MSEVIEAQKHFSEGVSQIESAHRIAKEANSVLRDAEVARISMDGLVGVASSFFNVLLQDVLEAHGRAAVESRLEFAFAVAKQQDIYQRSREAVLKNRRVFVSYSWSSAQHVEWVMTLCRDLLDNGVDVVIDKWSLKQGDDLHAFMEKCVTDRSIDRVLIISDRTYAEKADGRKGGVGTETQIISPEVYGKEVQDRFIPIATEFDENGVALVPRYLRSRVYINMSDPAEYEDRLEEVVRTVFDKPKHVKPPLGAPPSYLTESDPSRSPEVRTLGKFRRATSAIQAGKATVRGDVSAVLDGVIGAMSEMAIVPQDSDPKEPFDELVIQSIDAYRPYRDQIVDLLDLLCRYSQEFALDEIRRFLERMLERCFWPKGRSSWRRDYCDNFRFMAQETLLHSVAMLLRHECFGLVDKLLGRDFCLPDSPGVQDRMQPFTVFRQGLLSMQKRNERLRLGRLSVTADLLRDRATSTVSFVEIMQADFLLFLRADLRQDDHHWWPDSLVFSTHWPQPFELFLRSRSRGYFEKARVAIGASSVDELRGLIGCYAHNSDVRLPRWQFDTLAPDALADIENLCSRP